MNNNNNNSSDHNPSGNPDSHAVCQESTPFNGTETFITVFTRSQDYTSVSSSEPV
jgi:hypothetical protein